nr:hypothetical protein CFP56_02625 [Quercus suber]
MVSPVSEETIDVLMVNFLLSKQTDHIYVPRTTQVGPAFGGTADANIHSISRHRRYTTCCVRPGSLDDDDDDHDASSSYGEVRGCLAVENLKKRSPGIGQARLFRLGRRMSGSDAVLALDPLGWDILGCSFKARDVALPSSYHGPRPCHYPPGFIPFVFNDGRQHPSYHVCAVGAIAVDEGFPEGLVQAPRELYSTGSYASKPQSMMRRRLELQRALPTPFHFNRRAGVCEGTNYCKKIPQGFQLKVSDSYGGCTAWVNLQRAPLAQSCRQVQQRQSYIQLARHQRWTLNADLRDVKADGCHGRARSDTIAPAKHVGQWCTGRHEPMTSARCRAKASGDRRRNHGARLSGTNVRAITTTTTTTVRTLSGRRVFDTHDRL